MNAVVKQNDPGGGSGAVLIAGESIR